MKEKQLFTKSLAAVRWTNETVKHTSKQQHGAIIIQGLKKKNEVAGIRRDRESDSSREPFCRSWVLVEGNSQAVALAILFSHSSIFWQLLLLVESNRVTESKGAHQCSLQRSAFQGRAGWTTEWFGEANGTSSILRFQPTSTS